MSKLDRMITLRAAPFQNENVVNTSKKLLKKRNQTLSVVHYFTWKMDLVPDILGMIVETKLLAYS